MKTLRITYVENYKFGNQEHEAYVFETKLSDCDEWGLVYACAIINDGVPYTALTTVRQYMNLGYKVFWV